jgi:hypothetical protein
MGKRVAGRAFNRLSEMGRAGKAAGKKMLQDVQGAEEGGGTKAALSSIRQSMRGEPLPPAEEEEEPVSSYVTAEVFEDHTLQV